MVLFERKMFASKDGSYWNLSVSRCSRGLWRGILHWWWMLQDNKGISWTYSWRTWAELILAVTSMIIRQVNEIWHCSRFAIIPKTNWENSIDKVYKTPFQGLLGNLILGNDVLTDWSIYPLDIDTAVANGWLQAAHSGSAMEAGDGPMIYSGTLKSTGLAWDTFVKLNGWTKVRRIFGYYEEYLEFVILSNYMAFCFLF